MGYFENVGGAISQLLNALLFAGDNNYSVSADAYRLKRKRLEKVINSVFRLFEDDHCYKSYLLDVQKAEQLAIEAGTDLNKKRR